MLELISRYCREAGFDLPQDRLQALANYEIALLEQNRVMNLTAIREPEAAARLHILDALHLLRAADFSGKSVLDVGTGGGVPGVVLKLAQPDIQLTLLDATAKKIRWLQSLSQSMGFSARFIVGRAEDEALLSREHFDIVTARAVSRLNVLCEICLPFVTEGGMFLAMKGPEAEEELSQAARGIRLLGGRIRPLYYYDLPVRPDGLREQRAVVVVEKIKPTPPQYPRTWAKIRSSPL